VRLAHIVPTAYLTSILSPKDTLHLCLDRLVGSSVYAGFYKHRAQHGDHIIVDSDVFESRQPSTTGHLIRAVKAVHAHEVILPDDLDSAEETLRLVDGAVKQFRADLPHVRLIAVPHGGTLQEYLSCVRAMSDMDVDAIGIVEEAEPYDMTRSDLIYSVMGVTNKDLHLNGTSENCAELLHSDIRLRVASADTSKFVVWGLNGVPCYPDLIPDHYPGRASLGGRSAYFSYRGATQDLLGQAAANIAMWRQFMEA
jgi:hypothetical protein